MAIKRLRGIGDVYIDGATRDVDCDQFDFDYATSIANLVADPNNTVAITTAGNATPLRARQIRWNMAEDKITITEPTGGAAR
jgi:hypothetical protein